MIEERSQKGFGEQTIIVILDIFSAIQHIETGRIGIKIDQEFIDYLF